MDDDAPKQVQIFKYPGSLFTEDGKNKEDIIKRIKEAKFMFNNKKQLLCSNNLCLEMKNKFINSCIWKVSLCGSETWTLGKNEERVVNVFEIRCWRRMLKIKWTDRITNEEVWIGHIIRYNEFVVNILEGAISGKKAMGRPRLQYLKQVARNIGADSCVTMKRIACNKYRWKAAKQSKD
jgi:hypothetical protein